MTQDEIDTLNRLVVIFLESAELRAKNKLDITMDFWKQNVDRMLEFNDKQILSSTGTVSNSEMETKVLELYNQFETRRKISDALEADKQDLEELEKQIKSKKKK